MAQGFATVLGDIGRISDGQKDITNNISAIGNRLDTMHTEVAAALRDTVLNIMLPQGRWSSPDVRIGCR